MDPAYGQRYRDLYRRHWWWRAREAEILRELRRLRPLDGQWRILDVGCGDGLFFDHLSRFGQVEGVEPDVALLDPGGPWRGVIHAARFDSGFDPGHRFDVILMLDVLEHLEAPVPALQHALRLLSPGGRIIITVPALQCLWTRHDELNHHVRRYDGRSFGVLARAGGLRILRQRYLFQWLVPAKLFVRGFQRVVPAAPRPPRIPPAPINALLTRITQLEQSFNAVVPMPFGSSLLAVGGHAAG